MSIARRMLQIKILFLGAVLILMSSCKEEARAPEPSCSDTACQQRLSGTSGAKSGDNDEYGETVTNAGKSGEDAFRPTDRGNRRTSGSSQSSGFDAESECTKIGQLDLGDGQIVIPTLKSVTPGCFDYNPFRGHLICILKSNSDTFRRCDSDRTCSNPNPCVYSLTPIQNSIASPKPIDSQIASPR